MKQAIMVGALLSLLACGGPGTAPRQPSSSAPAAHVEPAVRVHVSQGIPADLRGEVDRARQLGLFLFAYDRATAVASKLVKDKLAAGSPRIIGFLVGPRGPALEVVFFVGQEPLTIGHRVVMDSVDAEPTYEKLDPPQRADAYVARFKAWRSVLDKVGTLAQPSNAIVVPADSIGEQGILVYLIAAQLQPDTVVLGRHYRARVTNDGATILELEPLTKAPVVLPYPSGGKFEGIDATTLTDTPLETHVFASLRHRLPVIVTTPRGRWMVDGDEISFFGDAPAH